MVDSIVCDDILNQLREEGPLVVQSDNEAYARLKADAPKRVKKSAMSSLIRKRWVKRERPAPEGCSDPGQPITFTYVKG